MRYRAMAASFDKLAVDDGANAIEHIEVIDIHVIPLSALLEIMIHLLNQTALVVLL